MKGLYSAFSLMAQLSVWWHNAQMWNSKQRCYHKCTYKFWV